jgi:hypothetical protein
LKPTIIDIDSPKPESQVHLNETEEQSETASADAQFWTNDAGKMELAASILHALPSFNVHGTPFGCGIEIAWGGFSPLCPCTLSRSDSTWAGLSTNLMLTILVVQV